MTIVRKLKSEFDGIVGQDLMIVPFTTIQNRAQINRSFTPIFGNVRTRINSISRVLNESGPNGREVWETDKKDSKIRFIGNVFSAFNSVGTYVDMPIDSEAEITFYGTYLNIMLRVTSSSRDLRASINGAPEGANLFPQGLSSLLDSRNSNMNTIVNLVKGLTEGWHTVKIRSNTNNVTVFGFESGTDNTNIQILQGEAFVNGYEFTNDAIISIPYSTGFENVLDVNIGTKGGKAVVYIDSKDNAVKKRLTKVDTANFIGATDHSNEKVSRVINFREYGRNRADDFETLAAGSSDRSFTLDSGSDTLVGNDVKINANGAMEFSNAVGSFWALTFFGTGLDILQVESNATGPEPTVDFQAIVDGVVQGSIDTELVQNRKRVIKICSGLEEGFHTVKLLLAGGIQSTGSKAFQDFIIYEPKQPSVPEGSLKICEYNLLADYDDSLATSSTVGAQKINGSVFKASMREVMYKGTWTVGGLNPSREVNAFGPFTTTNGNSFEYNFLGDNILINFDGPSGSSGIFTVEIDGVLNASGVALTTNLINNGGGTYTSTTPDTGQDFLSFRSIGFGPHTIKVTKTGGLGIELLGFYVGMLTFSSNTSIGSNSIKDLRNFRSGKIRGNQQNRNVLDLHFNGFTLAIRSSTNVAQILKKSTANYLVYLEDGMEHDSFTPMVMSDERATRFIGQLEGLRKHVIQFQTVNNADAESASVTNTASIIGRLEKDVLEE